MGKLLVKCQPQGLRNKMPVVSKKQEKFMQAVANNPKFAKKVGVKQSIGREFTKEKGMKTKKMNMGGMADREGRAMAAGRLAGRPGMMADARGRAMMKNGGKVKKMNKGGRTDRTKSIMNEKDEIRRVDREIRDNEGYMKGGKVGYVAGGMATGVVAKKAAKGLKKMIQKAKNKMADKEGRALAKDKKGMTAAQMSDARGRAMKTGGMLARTGGSSAKMKAKGKKMMGGGKVKAYKKGGAVSSASKRADGIAQRGHTRGRHV